MPALREIFASFGIEFDRNQNLQRGNRATLSLEQRLRGLAQFAGGALVVGAVRRFVGNTLALADNLDKTAQQVGLTTRELQAYSHAAELAGVDSSAFTNSIAQLQNRAAQAMQDGGEMAEAFSRIGVSVTGSNGELVSGSELLRRVADGLHNTTNSSLRTAASMDLMGRSGRRMLPMLAQGRAGLEGLEEQLDALGGGVSQEFIDRSVEINDNITRWRTAFLSLRSALILNFLPAANNAVTAITRWTAGISRNRELVGLISLGFTTLGAIAVAAAVRAAAAWLAAGWPVLLAAVAVGVLTLAVDELWTTWQGGDSILRQFINELFPGVEDGLTTTDQLIVSLTMGVAVLTNYLGNLWDIAVGTFDATAAAIAGAVAQLEAFGVALQMVLSGGRRGDLRTVVGAYAQATGKNVERTTRGYTAARGRIGEGLGGIGERRTAYASGHLSDEDRARSLSYLPERIRGTGHARPSSPKVDARQTVSVTIHEATDAREVDRRVQEGIREAGERQARQLVAALVPGGES